MLLILVIEFKSYVYYNLIKTKINSCDSLSLFIHVYVINMKEHDVQLRAINMIVKKLCLYKSINGIFKEE